MIKILMIFFLGFQKTAFDILLRRPLMSIPYDSIKYDSFRHHQLFRKIIHIRHFLMTNPIVAVKTDVSPVYTLLHVLYKFYQNKHYFEINTNE